MIEITRPYFDKDGGGGGGGRVVHTYRPDGRGIDPWGPSYTVRPAHNASIDEIPPLGAEGPLSRTPPATLGGVTGAQLDRSAARGVAGIERSQPTGDKT